MHNNFTWADLSTFDLRLARDFYYHCFNWKYDSIGDGYLSCSASGHHTAGLYTMPKKFQDIGMPSFWMSYIHVADIDETVNTAKELGAIVEIASMPAQGGATVALVRDPAGAGFTCYQGEELGGRNNAGSEGCQIWNELHVSDYSLVEPFYTKLFNWHLQPANTADRYEIFSSAEREKPIAGIQVTDNLIKGDKEYWGVYFAVNSIASTSDRIRNNSGEVLAQQPLGNREVVLAYDCQGAAFYVVEK